MHRLGQNMEKFEDKKHYHKGIDRMDNNAGKMVPNGIKSPYPVIYCMWYPGKRMPIGDMEAKKSPLEKGQTQWSYIRIFSNIWSVVPFNKLILQGREIYEKGS